MMACELHLYIFFQVVLFALYRRRQVFQGSSQRDLVGCKIFLGPLKFCFSFGKRIFSFSSLAILLLLLLKCE